MIATLFVSYMCVSVPGVAVNVTGFAGIDSGEGKSVLNRFDPVPEKSTVFTMPNSYVQIRLASGTLVRLGPSTTVQMGELENSVPRGKRKESVRLVVGKIWARVTDLFGRDSRFDVEAPNAVAGIRGTYLLGIADGGGGSSFYSIHGAVEVKGDTGTSVVLNQGQGVSAGPSGLGEVGTVSPVELATLIAEVAGPSGAIQTELLAGQTFPAPGPVVLDRNIIRNELVGPEKVVDSPLQGGGAPSFERGTVDVKVELLVPTRE